MDHTNLEERSTILRTSFLLSIMGILTILKEDRSEIYCQKKKKHLPCRRRSDDNTWPCRPGLSWAARPAAPAATPCQPSRGYVDDRYHRPSIRTAWRLRAVGRRSRPAVAEPLPWAPYPRVHRPPATVTAPECDCWAHRRGSTSSCHLSVSATKLWKLDYSSGPACSWFIPAQEGF